MARVKARRSFLAALVFANLAIYGAKALMS
jgi:hypothetical protein